MIESPAVGEGRHLMLAIPVMGGFPAGVVASLWNARRALEVAGYRVTLLILEGHCHVDDARNSIVRRFLETDAETLIFIDADVAFPPLSIRALADASRHEQLVGGVYPYKRDPIRFPVRMLGGPHVIDDRGLLEVQSLPTGFMAIGRECIETLAADAPRFREHGDREGATTVPVLFERSLDGLSRVGGDFGFCRKWRARGGRVYLVPQILLTHIGQQQWSAVASSWIAEENGLDSPAFLAAVDLLRRGQDVDHALAAMVAHQTNPFVASAGLLRIAYSAIRMLSAPLIVETGSGLSTAVMAIAAEPVGGRVVALENDPRYLAITRARLDRLGITNVDLYYAPLEQVDGGWWYELSDDIPRRADVLFIDGPKRWYGARNTAVERIDADTVILDDAETEAAAIEQWAASQGRAYRYIDDATRPCAIVGPYGSIARLAAE